MTLRELDPDAGHELNHQSREQHGTDSPQDDGVRRHQQGDAVTTPRVRKKKKALGNVAFVGAGPGDPGLLTVRGRDLLARADVVVAWGVRSRARISDRE